MRSEKEMFGLILGFAEKDERVRAVIMNGSRTNPKIKRDCFQDYDIVYLVDNYDSFIADHRWIDVFGKLLVHQLPDYSPFYPDSECENSFGYLMQFADGNRIDLTVAKKEHFKPYCFDDKLAAVLMDKDNYLPKLPPPDESSHYVKKPSQNMFDASRCEFWWVSPYVSKGLWRGQVLFAQKHMEMCIRTELTRMLSWYAGTIYGFEISAGKCGDKLKDYLPKDIWKRYISTWCKTEEEDLWAALFDAGKLFTEISEKVALSLDLKFDNSWDINVSKFLRYTKALARDAEEINFEI